VSQKVQCLEQKLYDSVLEARRLQGVCSTTHEPELIALQVQLQSLKDELAESQQRCHLLQSQRDEERNALMSSASELQGTQQSLQRCQVCNSCVGLLTCLDTDRWLLCVHLKLQRGHEALASQLSEQKTACVDAEQLLAAQASEHDILLAKYQEASLRSSELDLQLATLRLTCIQKDAALQTMAGRLDDEQKVRELHLISSHFS